jgi:hypothetical protein
MTVSVNKFRKMKRIVIILISSLLGLLILGYIAIYILIDIDVKKNIKTAKARYSGNAEDALISYLLDTTNTTQNRTRIAIYSLGQIQSKKAMPILENLYKSDPEGKTCYRKHDSVLCQYEIHKALNASKANWWPMHSRLNK